MSNTTPAPTWRIRAEFRHPLSAADEASITALRASACARGYAVAVIHASWRGTTHFLAVAPEPGAGATETGRTADAGIASTTTGADGRAGD